MPLIQEAMRQNKAEARMQEALRRHEQMTSEMIQKAIREQQELFEEKLRISQYQQDIQEDIKREYAFDIMDKLDQRLKTLEERVMKQNETQRYDGNENSLSSIKEEIKNMEKRLLKWEVSIKKALDVSFPRFNALIESLEKKSLSEAPTVHSSPSTSDSKNLPESMISATALVKSSTRLAENRSLFSTNSTQTSKSPSPSRTTLQKQLSEAVKQGNVEAVQELLGAGAQVNFNDDRGWNPLHYATHFAQLDVVSLLLKRGANVNAKTSSTKTALMLASHTDASGRCASLLIRGGADVNCKDNSGDTALHIAARMNNHSAITCLLTAGAKRTIRNKYGQTPLQCASTEYITQQLR